MTDELQKAQKAGGKGAPAWMATFADLMSLLMCFFVLLLSFSEMDVLKYKQVAGSMESAFGVQRIVESSAVPKGTSIIAQEFSPGKPTPTPINEVRQVTVDDTRQSLPVSHTEILEEKALEREMAELMVDEIKKGMVDVELKDGQVILRIREHGSFESGSAKLKDDFLPVIEKIRMVLAQARGQIEVSGHTDNIPIATKRYRSNWELSASRAVSLVHGLINTGELDETRFSVNGFADTKPLKPNNTLDNRALNRRVEIVVSRDPNAKELTDLKAALLPVETKIENITESALISNETQ